MKFFSEDLREKSGAITSVDQLEYSQMVFYVHALGKRSDMEAYMPISVYKSRHGSLFCLALSKEGSSRDFSVTDCNVLLNRYNDHLLFNDEKLARGYLEFCLEQHRLEMDECEDPFDDRDYPEDEED